MEEHSRPRRVATIPSIAVVDEVKSGRKVHQYILRSYYVRLMEGHRLGSTDDSHEIGTICLENFVSNIVHSRGV